MYAVLISGSVQWEVVAGPPSSVTVATAQPACTRRGVPAGNALALPMQAPAKVFPARDAYLARIGGEEVQTPPRGRVYLWPDLASRALGTDQSYQQPEHRLTDLVLCTRPLWLSSQSSYSLWVLHQNSKLRRRGSTGILQPWLPILTDVTAGAIQPVIPSKL